jgi:hypothetical protein
LKVKALFTDYDGTIAPAGVRREESRIAAPVAAVLTEISARIPVAVVTSKDYSFVRPRTRFASAWACVSGLEIVLKDGTRFLPAEIPEVGPSFAAVKTVLPSKTLVERKLAADGRMLGFSVDWRYGPAISESKIESIARMAIRSGMHVVRDRGQPFLDIYALPPDKGDAIHRLSRLLGAKSGVVYMGDSEFDNSSFDTADISICVEHGQAIGRLRSEYVLGFDDVALMLSSLLESSLKFSPDALHMLRKRG